MSDFHEPTHPSGGHLGNWLETVFRRAEALRWCTRPFCTTCGCQEFRLAYLSAAAMQAGLSIQFRGPRRPREVLAECSTDARQLLIQTLIKGLQGVSDEWTESDAIRTVMVDLQASRRDRLMGADLATRLGNTPAGVGLMRMREHAELRARRSLEHEQFNSAEAVEERSRLRREQSAQRHAARQALARQRGQERLRILAALVPLPVPERLSRLAKDQSIKLGMVTDAVLEVQPVDLGGMDRTDAAALVARIGRRRGVWRGLRRMLERWLATG